MNQLSLNHESLRYYAYSVIKSQIHQVFRRAEEGRYLHLIAFIVTQTLKLQDMLIDTLLLAVQATINTTDKDHKDTYYKEREERNQSVTNLVGGLQKGFLDTISKIKIIIADVKLNAEQKVSAIDATLNTPKIYQASIEQGINDFNSNMANLQQGKIIMRY